MLLNESATVNPALTKDLIDMWVPRCYRQGLGPACVHSYLFMHTLTGPEDDEDLESAAVSPTFRRAKMHLLPTWYMSLGHEMNYEDRVSFAHDVVGPTLYKYVWCEIFFPRIYFSCNNFLQTQRALLLQRVRVQSGRGLVEAKVSKHRKIEDLQPEVPRFWTEDQYSRLLAVKRTWDPELVFSCRHCVGDGEEPGQVSASTRPSWRYQS